MSRSIDVVHPEKTEPDGLDIVGITSQECPAWQPVSPCISAYFFNAAGSSSSGLTVIEYRKRFLPIRSFSLNRP